MEITLTVHTIQEEKASSRVGINVELLLISEVLTVRNICNTNLFAAINTQKPHIWLILSNVL